MRKWPGSRSRAHTGGTIQIIKFNACQDRKALTYLGQRPSSMRFSHLAHVRIRLRLTELVVELALAEVFDLVGKPSRFVSHPSISRVFAVTGTTSDGSSESGVGVTMNVPPTSAELGLV
ncbi:unnamed protein product [Rhizoctonia solani]|uniref:Uncharacterized protein n=1 Tax=Rhizoctonia solani TaxID=456999 RepID=A0A8H3D6K2_9AGAM|nr:unnamed protein product [Rhizoctonia solani]